MKDENSMQIEVQIYVCYIYYCMCNGFRSPSFTECTYIPTAPANGVYITQLIRYSRVCGSYHDFLDRGCYKQGSY